MLSPAVSHNPARLLVALLCLPLVAVAGSLRVGPTRLDLSPTHPVAVLEVQNTGDAATLAQLDTFVWTQAGAGDLLEPTTDLVTTPLVLNLAGGETRYVRVGLRERRRLPVERSYRLFVREVAPTFVAGSGLRFAVRVGVPVFALPTLVETRPGTVIGSQELSWRWVPDIGDCLNVQVSSPSVRHDRVLAAEIMSASGEVLWRASEPAYVLAQSRRSLRPALCEPSVKEAVTLRLTTDSGTINLPVEAPSLIVDANLH